MTREPPDGGADALRPFGLLKTALLFTAAALLLWFVTHALIPRFALRTGWEPVLLWFLLGGFGVFLPLIATGFVLLQKEPRRAWRERLRWRRLTPNDWLWTVGGLVVIGLLSALSLAALTMFSSGPVQLHPSFMHMDPLTPDRYWLLAAWLPFWILNILGEEFLWRGVILPRQEVALGRWAWIANGAGWLLFHLAFGPVILVTLWPITFIVPYVVQRTKNSATGVVIHAAVNGPGFLAVAFGMV
jgi:membrane protease YdiL (CAAX protease family)